MIFIIFIYREVVLRFCDDENNRCLVVPENLKIDTVIPSKQAKGKILLFIKLRTCVLKMENIFSDVRFTFLIECRQLYNAVRL